MTARGWEARYLQREWFCAPALANPKRVVAVRAAVSNKKADLDVFSEFIFVPPSSVHGQVKLHALKGVGLPSKVLSYYIVPLDPALKGGAYSDALSISITTRNRLSLQDVMTCVLDNLTKIRVECQGQSEALHPSRKDGTGKAGHPADLPLTVGFFR